MLHSQKNHGPWPYELCPHRVNPILHSPAPALDEIKPFSPLHIELDTSKHGKGAFGLSSRPRVTSSTRLSAFGWSKRSNG
ncbi:hypothetical protein C8Q70DRAFT_584918 [Cubamyces menziesii]|nr:hypothetical protein C8Q70DRAFT_584918 [Cubamyces menziesii]